MEKFFVLLFAVSLLSINGCSDDTDKAKDTKNLNETATVSEENSNDTKSAEKTKSESQKSDKDITSSEEKKDISNNDLETATVTRIIDGDTIEINLNGKKEDVRLLLVDTPETKHPSKPVQPFGPEASAFAKEVLLGETVQVEYDGPKRDKYDRLLAYLWLDGKTFNEMLLEEGLARLGYVYDPPYTHFNEYMKAQNRAKGANKGIWSRSGYVTEDGFVYNEPQPTDSENQQEEYSGEKKYNPAGPDRDCGDFDTHPEAQKFYEAAGGSDTDPH